MENPDYESPFQSRNRGSFDFKCSLSVPSSMTRVSFNLVIEVLLISRFVSSLIAAKRLMFQSRNRGSFDFKHKAKERSSNWSVSFNLVIEVLLISRVGNHHASERGVQVSIS